jgi:hypothetical protein
LGQTVRDHAANEWQSTGQSVTKPAVAKVENSLFSSPTFEELADDFGHRRYLLIRPLKPADFNGDLIKSSFAKVRC